MVNNPSWNATRIRLAADCPPEAGPVVPVGKDDLLRVLQASKSDKIAMGHLRRVLGSAQGGLDLARKTDDEILKRVAALLSAGTLGWQGVRVVDGSAGAAFKQTAPQTKKKVPVAPGGGGGSGPAPAEQPPPPKPPPKKDPAPKKDVVLVTPELKVEYKAVLLDRNLSKHQKQPAVEYPVEPTYILASLSQDKPSPKFAQGATLSASPATAVEAYEDEKLTKKLDLSKPIPNGKLTAGDGFKVFLKGKAKGKFTLTLKVEDPSDAQFKADKPAEEKMAVVELIMSLHHHDPSEVAKVKVDPDTEPVTKYHDDLKNAAIPAQKELSDADKIQKGRLLHVQDAGHFGRAKLVLKKAGATDWPPGTDAYEVVVRATDSAGPDSTSTGLALYDAEWQGSAKSLPHKIKVADLKAADVTLWVEGKTASKKPLDLRLDLGLDRPAGGPSKSPKTNGDWAHFTVVKIAEVKLNYTAPSKKADAWDADKKRFTINLKSDPDGRKIKIGARLSEKLKDVTLHVMLAPDKNNLKAANWGVDLPAAWKWKDVTADVKHKDKKDRKDLLHVSDKTDAEGAVEVEVTLSRFGGEIYTPAAYADQDPHLAKYVEGNADLEKKKPVLASHSITVWRKFWYEVIQVEGVNFPAMTGAEGQMERAKVEMIRTKDQSVTRKTVDGFTPKAIYPEYMVKVGGGTGDALVVSDTNKAQFFKGVKAEDDKPVKVPILICDAQWDPDGRSLSKSVTWKKASEFPVDIKMSKLALDPPLQGGALLAGGEWSAKDLDPTANGGAGGWTNVRAWKPLAPGDISIRRGRKNLKDITVAVPAGAGPVSDKTYISLRNLRIFGASGPWLGEYSTSTQKILSVYDTTSEATKKDFQNTIAHECGHGFRQVAETQPGGIPAHPNQYEQNGSHCNWGGTKCVMYHQGPEPASINRFCDVCQPYVLVEDFSKLAVKP